MLLFTWLSWTTVAPRLPEFTARLDALTLPNYLARRYASALVGRVAAVIVLFASVLYLVAIFKGAGAVLQMFLAVDYSVAVLVTLIVVVFLPPSAAFCWLRAPMSPRAYLCCSAQGWLPTLFLPGLRDLSKWFPQVVG